MTDLPVPASGSADTSGAEIVITELARRGLTVGVAESLTGGLLVAELISIPGASAVVRGGIVAYNTALKHSLLGVDEQLLAQFGAVHPDVAVQMARGIRTAVAVDGIPADLGISTTGVAGPEPQDGQPVGTVFVGLATAESTSVIELSLSGSRTAIRQRVVSESLTELARLISNL